MSYKELIYQVEGNVAVITLNRPETLNALTMLTHVEMMQAIEESDKDDNVRVIVLTGAGKGFCAGDDVKEIFLHPDAKNLKGKEMTLKFLQGECLPTGGHALLKINKPSIAAVNGAAVGYGCDISLMCSMRIASEKARFGEVFLRMGVIPEESLLILPRLVGLAKAYELLLTTDIIDAAEAERIGMVNKVVPHDQLMPATMELANKIAKKPPVAVKLAMEAIRRGLGWNLDEWMSFHSLAFNYCFETEDHIESAKAFMEKRDPVYKGK
jgi:enoyl-CoA hydratase/carnithine racemase